MSTRATYKLSTGRDGRMICFYIHYDGYPEGAAEYFRAMQRCKHNRGGYAARFIRTNELAEFTSSHQAHGDTEYRYDLSHDGNLVAKKRIDFGKNWKTFYTGPWYDFINKLSEGEILYCLDEIPGIDLYLEMINYLKPSPEHIRHVVVTVEEAEEIIKEIEKTILMIKVANEARNPWDNRSVMSAASRLQKLIDNIEQLIAKSK